MDTGICRNKTLKWLILLLLSRTLSFYTIRNPEKYSSLEGQKGSEFLPSITPWRTTYCLILLNDWIPASESKIHLLSCCERANKGCEKSLPLPCLHEITQQCWPTNFSNVHSAVTPCLITKLQNRNLIHKDSKGN